MNKNDFVLEIGTEELPAGIVAFCETAEQKSNLINAIIPNSEISYTKAEVYATPRRIIIYIKDLPVAYERIEEGPPKRIAYDKDLKPTKALEGFLKKVGASAQEIKNIPDSDNEKVKIYKQASVKELITERLPKIFSAFSSYKNMHWQESKLLFPRPIRWLLVLWGREVVKCEVNGIASSDITYGHHLLAPGEIKIKSTDDFFKKLKKSRVLCSYKNRKQIISDHLSRKNSYPNQQLLDEVAGLLEYPDFIEGSFDKKYLKLPEEVLVASMSKNQRVFPLQDKNGTLLNKFIGELNGKLSKKNKIKSHYEKVLDAKLKDALFFYNEDLKKPITSRVEGLSGIVFHKKLGTYLDKLKRLEKLTDIFKDTLKLSESDCQKIKKVYGLCKADLSTQMVGEFPSLQGVMGKYYAQAIGIDKDVAQAIEEHYKPRFSGDDLPKTKLGAFAALIDKFDSVICHFKAGHQPKGNWDLYALRRQTIAIINIILSNKIQISLSDMFDAIFDLAPVQADKNSVRTIFEDFIKERLIVIMHTQNNFRPDLIDAVALSGYDNVHSFYLRLSALNNIIDTFYFEQARCVAERTYNITKKVGQLVGEIDTTLFKEEEEKSLFEKYNSVKKEIEVCISQSRYDEATKLYGEVLFKEVDNFFDKVMVNVEDEDLKNNRLKLIKSIRDLYASDVADLSKIVVTTNKN